MKLAATLATLALSFNAGAAEFNAPWNDAQIALVIDPYAANSLKWDALAGEPRVVAIIHKATIGTQGLDKAYWTRKAEARQRGYLWGSYHWGVAGDPEKQADYYLDTVKPGDDELIALDLEDATSRTLMSAAEAVRFIERIHARSGRYPVLYTNHASAVLISKTYKNSVFAHTPLWYARFKTQVTDFPKGLWPTYTLWQFSSEIKPQKAIPGTRSDMDVNVFNGSVEQLRTAWPLTQRAP
ncbi:MAG TPA: glycoside hydrolase family 25 protein [Rhodocyclaceae bacterium]|nr:glycoside hydrolase family 25 protein [Rhodocyclaceae bacterium]